jgi:hypothetical protein
MRKHLLLLVALSASFLLAFTQPQIKTATYLNNLNRFRDVFGDQNYPRATAGDLSTDDDIYGCSSKLVAIKDSAQSFRSNSVSSLALQGFGFAIPGNATIQNISLRLRRFNSGRAPVGDYFLTLMQRYQAVPDTPSTYGRMWTNLDDYPGKIYPDAEAEYTFWQSGSGNDGGYNHDQPYAWTPAMVNHTFFGVRIDNFPPVGRGTAQVCYDLVEITVQYSQPPIAGRLQGATESQSFKQPIIYPNPFATKTNLQFTAAESGNAVVELYNINGSKVRSLFSGHVVQGQVYNVAAGDAQLSKGIYIYSISNGRQQQRGRIIKME